MCVRVTAWTSPRQLHHEWFASALDVCRALAMLERRGGGALDDVGLAILAENQGGVSDREHWLYAGFKGGSEPGVLSFSWLLKRRDERWFSLVVILNDEARNIDANEVIHVARSVVALLGAMPSARRL